MGRVPYSALILEICSGSSTLIAGITVSACGRPESLVSARRASWAALAARRASASFCVSCVSWRTLLLVKSSEDSVERDRVAICRSRESKRGKIAFGGGRSCAGRGRVEIPRAVSRKAMRAEKSATLERRGADWWIGVWIMVEAALSGLGSRGSVIERRALDVSYVLEAALIFLTILLAAPSELDVSVPSNARLKAFSVSTSSN